MGAGKKSLGYMIFLVGAFVLLAGVLAVILIFGGSEKSGGKDVLKRRVAVSDSVSDEKVYCGDLVQVSNANHLPEVSEEGMESIYESKSESYYVKDREVLLRPKAIDALNAWMDAFVAQGGEKRINVVAGWRSEEMQRELYDNSAALNGKEHADRYVAQPGGSEHHTGLAVDLHLFFEEDGSSAEFDGTGQYAWLTDNCWRYGFILRYSGDKENITGIAAESWHFRYVGAAHSRYIYESDLCLEEYLALLRNYTSETPLTVTGGDGAGYDVYYTSAEEMKLPESGAYDVSGNGTDGFIVTVRR